MSRWPSESQSSYSTSSVPSRSTPRSLHCDGDGDTLRRTVGPRRQGAPDGSGDLADSSPQHGVDDAIVTGTTLSTNFGMTTLILRAAGIVPSAHFRSSAASPRGRPGEPFIFAAPVGATPNEPMTPCRVCLIAAATTAAIHAADRTRTVSTP